MKTIIFSLSVAVFLLFQSCNESRTYAQSIEKDQSQLTAEIPASSDKMSEPAGTIKINAEEFKSKVFNYVVSPNVWKFEGDLPCIVDFYADWCAPCRMMASVLEELAKENSGKIRIYKVDIQKEQEIAMVFGIQSIPSFLFCPKEGEPMMTSGIAGSLEETKILFQQQINTYLLMK